MTSGVDAGKNHYAVLGVSPDASNDEILAAWRGLAKRWHPDLHPDDPRAHERMRIINQAKDVLCDPERRREHDRARGRANQDDRGVPGDRPPTASPPDVNFGEVDAGKTSPVVEVSVRVSPRPDDVAPERDRGVFWSLTDDPWSVPRDDELSHQDEFLRVRLRARAPANPDRTEYRDELNIRFDSQRLTIPLYLRVRTPAHATASPLPSSPPSGAGPAAPVTRGKPSALILSDVAVAALIVLMHMVPVAALVAQGGLKNHGSAAAIPIWLAGFTAGLIAWGIVRLAVGARPGPLEGYLETPVPYLITGFFVWLIFGFVLYS